MDLPYEIVHVINARHVIDSESYQRALEAEQIGRLQPGCFYVVLWRSQTACSHFDASADYIGPFATRHAAEQAHALISAGVRMPASRSAIEASGLA
jgi:hypothetical protein